MAGGLLELVRLFEVRATPGFRARDHFRVDLSTEAKIGCLGGFFVGDMLDDRSQADPADPAESVIRAYRLREDAMRSLIIAKLGGEERARVTLEHVYRAMVVGQEALPGLPKPFVCWVMDSRGNLRSVYCFWSENHEGWRIDSFPIVFPDIWKAGNLVLARAA